MSKKPFGPIILVILGLLFIAAIGFRTISTPEIWTHLAQGRSSAPLSYTEPGNLPNTTWLYDKLAYTAWNMGKAPLLILLNIAGLLGTFTLLLQVSKKWGGTLSQGFALLIAGHLIFQGLDVGPEIAMVLFIALFLYLLSFARKPAVLFGLLIPLQILWTNMHGSFFYGPLLAGLAAIQAAQQNKSSSRSKRNQSLTAATYGILTAALALATLANPYLFKMHLQVVADLKSAQPAYWLSLFTGFFQNQAVKPLILFVMVLGACGLITLKKKLPVLLTTIAIYGAFRAIASSQMAMLFAVLSFPFVVLSLTAISEYIQGTLQHVLGENAKHMYVVTSIVFVLLTGLSFIPLASNCAYAKTGSASNFGLGIEEGLYPSGIDALLENPDFPPAEKTLNLPADGGYLAFNYENRKVFIDVRPGCYDETLLSDLNGMMRGDQDAYLAIYDTYRPEAMIINTLPPSAVQGIHFLLTLRKSDGTGAPIWRLVYFDGSTVILVLNDTRFASIYTNTEAQLAGLSKLENARADFAQQLDSCTAGNPAPLIGAAKVYLALNRLTESKALFSLLLKANDQIPGAWIGLGQSQLRLKNFDEAIQSLKTATEIAKRNPQAWGAYAQACRIYSSRSNDAAMKEELMAESERAAKRAEELMTADQKKQNDQEQAEE